VIDSAELQRIFSVVLAANKIALLNREYSFAGISLIDANAGVAVMKPTIARHLTRSIWWSDGRAAR